MAAVTVILALAGSALAAPPDNRDRERGRDRGIVKMIKKIVRAFGDGLTIPKP